jgi:branched-chain amino acid transport system permease protein
MVTLAFGTIIQILINEMTFLTEGDRCHHSQNPRIFGEAERARFYWLTFGLMVLSLVVVTAF